MLDTNMKTQLKAYLEKLTKPVELIATLDDSAKSAEIKELLAEIAELSDKVSFKEDNTLAVRKPSFVITTPGSLQGPRFAGSPLGHEFTSLVLALLWTGGHPSKEAQALLEQIRDRYGVERSEMVVVGMALGHADPQAIENSLLSERVSVSDFATFWP